MKYKEQLTPKGNPSVRCLKAAHDIAEGKKHALTLLPQENKEAIEAQTEIFLVAKFNYNRQSARELTEKYLLINS